MHLVLNYKKPFLHLFEGHDEGDTYCLNKIYE